jgi:hypothetical protein
LFAFHLVWIYVHAVDIPYQDEWDLLLDTRLASGLSLDWLHMQHNEHRVAMTRLQAWLHYRVDGWNLANVQTVNFFIFGLIPLALLGLMRRAKPGFPLGILCAFLLFVLSPADYWNHSMGFQVCYKLWLLSLILSARFLFTTRQRPWQLALGTSFGILGMWSLSSGVVSTVTLFAVYAVFKVQRIRESDRSRRRTEILQILLVGSTILAMVAVWLTGFQKPSHHPGLFFPDTWEFWEFWLNLISFGFSIDIQSAGLGAFCLVILLFPIAKVLIDTRGRPAPAVWGVFTVALALLASLAAVAVGRAGLGVESVRVERYVEFVVLLTPLAAMVWAIALQGRRQVFACLGILWLTLAFLHHDSWDFSAYVREAETRRSEVECLRRALAENGPGDCPTLYPIPLGPRLENARLLEISVIRRLNAERGAGS